MPLILARPMAATGRHLPQLHLPLPREKYVISNCSTLLILVIWSAFLWLTVRTCLLFLCQSKYKKDTSAAQPILFDESKVEVCFFPYFTFLMYACISHLLWLNHSLFHSIITLYFPSLSDTESIFVYHLMSEEAPIAIDILMEDFFNGVDAVAKAMASAMATTTRKVLAEASTFPSRPISAKESTPIVGWVFRESAPISSKLSPPSKGFSPPVMTQAKSIPSVTPL